MHAAALCYTFVQRFRVVLVVLSGLTLLNTLSVRLQEVVVVWALLAHYLVEWYVRYLREPRGTFRRKTPLVVFVVTVLYLSIRAAGHALPIDAAVLLFEYLPRACADALLACRVVQRPGT